MTHNLGWAVFRIGYAPSGQAICGQEADRVSTQTGDLIADSSTPSILLGRGPRDPRPGTSWITCPADGSSSEAGWLDQRSRALSCSWVPPPGHRVLALGEGCVPPSFTTRQWATSPSLGRWALRAGARQQPRSPRGVWLATNGPPLSLDSQETKPAEGETDQHGAQRGRAVVRSAAGCGRRRCRSPTWGRGLALN